MAIAVRATNERTLTNLYAQLKQQMETGDIIEVFGDQEPFAEKMLRVYKWCLLQNLPISLVIDADILLRKSALKNIRKKFESLPSHCSGFGVMLFDRYFKRPKFRGLHIYRTCFLNLYIQNLPKVIDSLRPETDLKKIVGNLGHPHDNGFVNFYVAGLHDYDQWYRDIYFKMLIRSHRSPELIAINYIPDDETQELKTALQAIKDGQKIKELTLDKKKIVLSEPFPPQKALNDDIDVDLKVKNALKRHYGWSLFYYAGLYLCLDKFFLSYLRFRNRFKSQSC
jgi:hypothetical protein